MGAARKVSRLAVAAPALSPTAETFRIESDLPQDDRLEGLPFGTRGGRVIRYNFPEDAEYVITVTSDGRATEPHELIALEVRERRPRGVGGGTRNHL